MLKIFSLISAVICTLVVFSSSSFAQVTGESLSLSMARDAKTNRVLIYLYSKKDNVSIPIGSKSGYKVNELKARLDQKISELQTALNQKYAKGGLITLAGVAAEMNYFSEYRDAVAHVRYLEAKPTTTLEEKLSRAKFTRNAYKGAALGSAILIFGGITYLILDTVPEQSAIHVLHAMIDGMNQSKLVRSSDVEISEAQMVLSSILK